MIVYVFFFNEKSKSFKMQIYFYWLLVHIYQGCQWFWPGLYSMYTTCQYH